MRGFSRLLRRRWPAPWPALALLVIAQWAALAAFVDSVRHNGWLFYQGGDETFFYTSSWALAGGHIPEAAIGYAWSYLLTPISVVAGANFLAALPAIVLLQVVFFMPVALVCVYAITARICGRGWGYVAAALWVAAPYAAIPLWDSSYHTKYVEDLLPQAFGLTGLGDYPSMVCVLVAALFCVRALDDAGPFDAVFAGLAAGFAIGIKPSNAIFLASPLLAFAAARHGRNLARFALALSPSLITLALWKYRGLGHLPLLTPTPHAMALGAGGSDVTPVASVQLHRYLNLDFSRLRDNYYALRGLLSALVVWQALPVLGFAGAMRRSIPKALLLASWAAAFILVKGTSDEASIDGGTLLRLFMPGFPPLLIMAALAPVVAIEPKRGGTTTSARTPRAPRRALAAVVLFFAALPFALVAALPPLRAPTAVKYFDENVFSPVIDLSVRAASRSGTQIVTWKPPASMHATAFYRVFRAPMVAAAPDPTLPPGRNGIRCLDRSLHGYAGAADCRLEMTVLGTTAATSFRDRPPRGRWVYRVGVVANWLSSPTLGDVMVLSERSRPIRPG